MVRFVFGSSLLLGLVNRGVEMVEYHRAVLFKYGFIVALYVTWCRHLDALPSVKPQLYADNLKCSAELPFALFEAVRFTAQYVQSVGQDVSPGKCVLLSTSKSVRKDMKLWDVSGNGSFWKVQLDVRDLGGHLDFTLRARAGTLSKRVRGVTFCWCFTFRFSGQVGAGSSPSRPLVHFGLLLFVRFGPLRCLLPMLLPFLTFLMGLLELILLFALFGPGFV